ncbi:MAG TPA: tetratricopeptide repeat protein, partial [Candidatus Wallbacteria bacterium]|nr:tetratricopeptide repeat protein [Candidatus Wallbacteria bacterium]
VFGRNNLALVYKDMGHYDNAIEEFTKVIEFNPTGGLVPVAMQTIQQCKKLKTHAGVKVTK